MSHQEYFTGKENPDERLLKLIKRKAENVEFLLENLIPFSQTGFGSSGVSRGVDLDDITTTAVDVNVINIPDGALTDDGNHEATIDLVISIDVVEGVPFSGAATLGQTDGSVVIIQTSGVFEFSTSAEIIPLENQIGTPTYDTVQDGFTVWGSCGLIDGGAVTDGGSETIDVAALTGAIRSTDDHTGDIFTFDFAGSTGHSIPTNTNQWIGIEYNAGSPQVVVKSTDDWNGHDEFAIACVTNEGGTLHIINNPEQIANAPIHILERFYDTSPRQRNKRTGGLIIGETGTRNVTMTAGELWDRLSKFTISAIDTSGADTFDSYSSGGQESTGNTQWDNNNYDNAGTLTVLSNNKFANVWFWLELDGPYVCVYGTGQYNSLAEALAESPPTTLPDRIVCHGELNGRIVFQKGDSTAQVIESVYDVQFQGAGVTDHNSTSGKQGGTSGEYYHLTAAEYADLWVKGTETTCAIGLTVIDLGAISDDAQDHQVRVQYRTGIHGHVLSSDSVSGLHYKGSGNLKVAITNISGTDVEATVFHT